MNAKQAAIRAAQDVYAAERDFIGRAVVMTAGIEPYQPEATTLRRTKRRQAIGGHGQVITYTFGLASRQLAVVRRDAVRLDRLTDIEHSRLDAASRDVRKDHTRGNFCLHEFRGQDLLAFQVGSDEDALRIVRELVA
tara:strand:+ start:42 stop:452 length:411 start_codon:yes stop_codon:yes gene_type:complete